MSFGIVVAIAAIVVCGMTVPLVVVQLVRGDVTSRPLRGESTTTKRAVRRAIRDGETDDPRIDELARAVIQATPSTRWTRYIFGTLLLLSIIQLVAGPYRPTEIVLHGSEFVLWSSFLLLDFVNRRRLTTYRGLTPTPARD